MAGSPNPYDAVVASMPPAGEQPYDRVVADLAVTAPAKASLVAAQGSNPDTTARALAVSNRLSVPVDVAERNLPDFEAIDKTNQYEQLLRTMPTAVKRWVAEPVNASVVGDDLGAVVGQASLWRGLADAGRSTVAGLVGGAGSMLAGAGEGLAVVNRTTQRLFDAVGVPKTFELPWYLDPPQILKRPAEQIKGVADAVAVPKARENLVDQVFQGVGQIGTQIAALTATGGAGGLAMLFSQGIDQMADEVQKSGKAGTVQADLALVGGGMATAIAEKMGLDLLLNRLPPAIKNKFARVVVDIVAAGGIEAAEEAVEQVAQNALSNFYLGAHHGLMDNTLAAAIPAGGSAALVRGALLGGGRFRRRELPNVEQPVSDAAALDQVYGAVRGTGLAGRSPEKLAELLASMGDRGNVYIPAEAVRTYLQSLEPEAAQQQARALGIEGQLEQAMATGGDVVIPLHQYVAHAPEAMAKAWHDDLRLRSSGMSINEAKAFKDGADELGGMVEERLQESARQNDAREQVAAMVEKQLQDAGEPPEASRQIAQLFAERYVTRAVRLGQGDAVSQYGRSGVTFRSDLPEVIRHAPADDLELLVKALKRGKRDRSEVDQKGPTILQYIARNGGIVDAGGELAARDIGTWHRGKPFQRKVLRDQVEGEAIPGMVAGTGDNTVYGPDAWALRLWEQGYFPEHQERPQVQDLYDAIDQELRGKPRRLETGTAKPWVDDFQSALMELDELLTRAGVDARKASVEEIRKALQDPDGAIYEQAFRPRAFIEFGRKVALALQGKLRPNEVIAMGDTPQALRLAGAPRAPMVMRASVASKVVEDKHSIGQTLLERLPDHLQRPVAVFESATEPNALVALLDAADGDGNPVLVALHLADKRITVNRVVSVYGKERDTWIDEQVADGRLRYLDTEKEPRLASKAVSGSPSSEDPGVQSPESGQQRGAAPLGSGRKVATQADLVKKSTYEQAVYHGSPYVFDKFTLDHIGTGEGAQVYGWGLYFASNKAVARYYRNTLAKPELLTSTGTNLPLDTPAKRFAADLLAKHNGDFVEAWSAMAPYIKGAEVNGDQRLIAERSEALELLGQWELDGVKLRKGRLYHVEIPDDGAYLHWDKPLAEQSPEVKAALGKLGVRFRDHEAEAALFEKAKAQGVDASTLPEYKALEAAMDSSLDTMTGGEFYRELGTRLDEEAPLNYAAHSSDNDKAASLALREAGIPGIQYLDGQSRTKGEGSHNYVLFDDALAVIKQFEQPAGEGTPRGNIAFTKADRDRLQAVITLFKDRNLSTVAHETGHLWLEELQIDAGIETAPQQLRDDLAIVRRYLGAEGDAPFTVRQHEKWARTVEAYLREGKSPSLALSGPLARFRAWLVSIYRTVLQLDVEINDEVRGVIDRLIATDEAITEAQTEIHARELFASADQAGMTETEYQAYVESVARSRDVAEQDVLAKLMDDVRRRLTAQWKEETDALRAEVRPAVDSQPDIMALRYLRDGTLPDSLAHLRDLSRLRLSREALIEEYGNPEIVNALPRSVPPLIVERGGVRPAEIAELLGFTDGRSMIDALTRLAKEQAALKASGDRRSVRVKRIDDEVDRLMIERHGAVLTDGSIEAEALSALHNDARSDVLAAELRALARKAGEQATPYKLARDWARRAVAEKTVGEIGDLSQYTRAESRAGFLALEATAKGDADEALRRKQEQMIAHALWMEARDAKERIETARRKMDRLAGSRTLRSMDQDYLEKIHALLERFDLKPRSRRSIGRSESLREWADAQQIAGIDVAVPSKLLEEAYRTNYRRMTVEEFQGLADSVDQLAHLGRMKQKFLDGKEQREFDEVVEAAVKVAGEGRQSGDTTTDIGKTNFQRRFGAVISRLRSADAALLKVEYLFNWLDGNKAGPFTRLFQRMSDAQAGERSQWLDIGGKLRDLFHKLPMETRRRLQDVAVYPELNGEELRRDALIAVALNMGNESNKEKMLKGHKWTEEGVLRAIDRGLGKEELAFVQETWDLIETLWPQIAAMERRVNGVAPEKVEPSELVIRHGTLRGGYYPLVYEPKRAAQQGDRTDALTAENFGSEVYTRATTPKGFTKERVEGFARPVHLSLEVIPQHLMEVVHDLHWREPIMAAQRFLNDARIKNAIREKLGREYEAQLQPWLNHMALEYARDRQGMAGWDRFMKQLRTNVTMVGMGYRLTTIFSQVGGFADATAELGPRWMASGFKAYMAHPIDSIEFVREKSGEMKHRADNLDRDIRKATREMVGEDRLLDPVRDFAFKGIAWADAAVTIPTWLGGYNRALHEGKSDAEAVQYADSMVRRSQGASGSKDLVRLQTSGEAGKLVTMFYSYFSHYYNAQRDVGRRLIDAQTPADFGDALARAFWLNGPGVLAAALLAGQGPEDEESWGAWASRTAFFNLFMGIPIARDLASQVSNAVAGRYVGGYQLSPAARALEVGGKFVIRDLPGVVTGEPSKRWVQNTVTLPGYLLGLPTGQPATTMQFLYDALWSREARPEDVTDWLKGMVYGTPKK
jgi:hypothetical protein